MALVDSNGHLISSTPLSEEQIASLMAEEIRALDTTPPILTVTPLDLLIVAGVIQLGTRHPNLPANHRLVATGFIDMVEEYFRGSPTVLDILRKGANPQFDR